MPENLFKITADALKITGPPHWPSPDDPAEWDVLAFVDTADIEGAPLWALLPGERDNAGAVRAADLDTIAPDELLPIAPSMVSDLIAEHLRSWLLYRGWQVHVSICKSKRIWRLTDCLSIADGGGDRLDDDYPYGDEELYVVCASVCVVRRASRFVTPRS